MNICKGWMLGCLLVLGSVSCSWAGAARTGEGYVQVFENGTINWQTGVVTAVGLGTPPAPGADMTRVRARARRAAVVVARRNLLEVIRQVRIDAETTVGDYLAANDALRTSVRGFLQNSPIEDVACMSDGSVEATVTVTMRGGLANLIMPKTMPYKEVLSGQMPGTSAAAVTLPGSDAVLSVAASNAPVPAPESLIREVCTGLVVDATGTGARPALSPRIFDEQGVEVYGSSQVTREDARTQGLAGYAGDLIQAETSPRVTDRPCVVKAVSARGKGLSDLVISSKDAERVRILTENRNFLETCRVVIVLQDVSQN